MAAILQTPDFLPTLKLTKAVSEKLAQRAAERGKDPANYVSELIEKEVISPSIDEALAPFRKQVADSGMSDEELDEFFRSEIAAVRREKKAKPQRAFVPYTTPWCSYKRQAVPTGCMRR